MRKRIFTLAMASILATILISGCGETEGKMATGETGIRLNSKTIAMESGFSDVTSSAYYADAVNYCLEQGLMSGTSATTFAPDDPTSRAQLTTILWRQAGSPRVGNANFSDIPTNAYYTVAAAWANEQGIVTGYGNGRFAPNDPITRAQLSTILWRIEGSPSTTQQTDFSDQSSIPSYAVSAVAWIQASGIINGKSGNVFDPNGSATRGETATILYRYLTRGEQGTTPEPDVATSQLSIQVGNQTFNATLENNDTTRALREQLPMTVSMGDLNSNEKYYYLPRSLPTNSSRPSSINSGDLLLFGSDCLVLFYENFSSSYSYTPIGKIDNPVGLAEVLGSGDVQVTFR